MSDAPNETFILSNLIQAPVDGNCNSWPGLCGGGGGDGDGGFIRAPLLFLRGKVIVVIN